ncbi:6-phosphogluconolactonase (cycloisomerase 2 family) [Microbacterium sp. AG790]|uniref:lactonase family protein n=1 Tax=Microbacterium sp. AG790 TaxID=2183995 RepID=UPI000EB44E0C|nr:beta-propeller fold lactonase family protein [Microbacterium sp. AG790]RKS90164.1 6-phosphogluconolactonase (cycloisomerase 2 family) [Microbacterium sp. AG790]
MRFFLGGYSADMGGRAEGVGTLLAGNVGDVSAGGELARRAEVSVRADSPSWLAWHPTLPVVYAALEGRGSLQAYRRIGEESFVRLGAAVEAGEAVCHLAVSPAGDALIAACWGDGRLVRISLDAEGRPSKPTVLAAASDPYALAGMSHQTRPSRAHHVRFLPRDTIATTDLGLDLVRFWRGDPARGSHDVALPRETGPRHSRWHPSEHLFVVTELSNELYALAPDASGQWRVVAGVALSPGALAGDAAAELAFSRDGRFVYAGLRGSNTIAVVEVRGDGAQLRPIALVDSGVDWPRHHVVVRDTLLVAGQRSDEIAALALDERTGVPGRARRRVDAPSPTCLLAAS